MNSEIISFDEASQIFVLIENSSFYEILLIAVILLPVYLGSWIYIFNQYNIQKRIRPIILSSLLFVYIIGIFLYKIGYENRISANKEHLDYKYEKASEKIINFLNSTQIGVKDSIWEQVGFNETRLKIDTRYSDEFLEALVDKYPDLFQRIYLRTEDPKGIKYKKSNN
jgi:hypothetical protein